MYLIGTNGSITHYNGHSFTLMESGTDADLTDIHGFKDEKTGSALVWITGRKVLLQQINNRWNQVWNIDNPLAIQQFFSHRVTAINERFLVLCVYNGPLRKNRIYLAVQENVSINQFLAEGITFDWSMSYDALNNIFIAGDFGNIEHYNGASLTLQNGNIYSDRIFSIKSLNKAIYAVGIVGQDALFIHGKQN